MSAHNDNDEAYDGPETTGWWRPICCIALKLQGKLAIITGANSGIGLALTGELARRGADVIMACRNLEKAQAAKAELLLKYGADNVNSVRVDVVDDKMRAVLQPIHAKQLCIEYLELSSFESIRAFAESITLAGRPVNFLVNNAAVISSTYEISADGHELQFAVNYLGPVLLTELLLPLLKKAPKARIVNISSMLHFTGHLHKPTLHLVGEDYGPYVAFSQSKLALTMYTVELAKRLSGTNVVALSVNPGKVNTKFGRESTSWMKKAFDIMLKMQEIEPWEAAQHIIYALLRRDPHPGGYYDNYERIFPDRLAMTQSERTWLWEKTKTMVQID